jgi:hypothetical protein
MATLLYVSSGGRCAPAVKDHTNRSLEAAEEELRHAADLLVAVKSAREPVGAHRKPCTPSWKASRSPPKIRPRRPMRRSPKAGSCGEAKVVPRYVGSLPSFRTAAGECRG